MSFLNKLVSLYRDKLVALYRDLQIGRRPAAAAPLDSQTWRYWAFISYSHYDRRVARWCQTELGKQRVPAEMRRLVEGSPSRLAPMFLDENAASASPMVNAELRTALDNSRYLIVICSPFAVASSYVSDEIRYFQSLGRGDRILCLAASGVPNATDDGRPNLECFPEPLRVRATASGQETVPLPERPLAAALGDETSDDKKRVIRQLTGGVLGLTDAYQRALSLRRKVAWGAAGLAAALALLFLLAAFVLPWRSYSSSYVRVWGKWQEVDSLSRWEASRIGEHYEFIRQGALGRPKAVRIVDGFGNCPKEGMKDVLGQSYESDCNTSRACEARFTYGQDGAIEKEEIVDQYGTTLETLSYTNPSVGLFTQAGFGCSQSHSGASYIKFDRDAAGRDQRITFWTPDKGSTLKSAANNDGVYGFQFEYGPGNRIAKITSLSPGTPQSPGGAQNNRDGYASVTRTYDSNGVLAAEQYFSPAGEPVAIKEGYASLHRTLDGSGRVLEEDFLDLNGHAVDSADGYAQVRYTRGSHGEALSEAYFDASGQATASKDGFASERMVYDWHGNRTEVSYFDTAGKPTANSSKIASMRAKFDKWGNPVDREYFGVDGKPTFDDNGMAAKRTDYDARGNPVADQFLGLNGEPVLSTFGASSMRDSFDKHNQVVDVHWFDTSGAPTLTDNGIAERQNDYDDNGNMVAVRYLGLDGKPTLSNDGISEIEHSYNSDGLEIEARSFGLNGQAAITNDMGVASDERYTYDPLGRIVGEAYFDGSGQPASDSRGVSSTAFTYDTRSRVTDRKFFGVDGKPVKQTNGVFAFHREFDDRGNLILEEYLDSTGALMLDNDGAAALKMTRDSLGDMLTGRYFGVGMQPVLATANHIAGWNSTFDEKGKQLSYEAVDLSGNLVADEYGVARSTDKYDAAGDLVEIQFFGTNGAPTLSTEGIGGWTSKYDDRHREIERDFIDTQGKAMVSAKLQYASWRMKYDDRGRVAEQDFFGLDGRPAITNNGYAIERMQYDDRGNVVQYSFFDENGQPAHLKEAAKETIDRNTFGWEMQRSFYDTAGQLAKNPTSGRAIVRFTYDSSGRVITEESFDDHDHPTNRTDLKYFKKTTTYDATGKATDVCTTTGGRVVNPCPKD